MERGEQWKAMHPREGYQSNAHRPQALVQIVMVPVSVTSSGSTTADSGPQSVVDTHVESDPLPQPHGSIRRGTEVSRYLILDTLGTGGMGRVFSAHDPELDRKVAIKVLFKGASAASSSGANELLREGRALASLRHPNIVSVYDVGWHAGQFFIAMEYVDGQTLQAWQADRPRRAHDILARYMQAAEALAAAHETGVVHGDFKPANVMVDSTGRTVVLDFGLSRARGDAERSGAIDGETPGAGTPAYMAPEQHSLRPATHHSDQYSFCVALYEAFVGARPFPQRSVVELAQAVLEGAWEEPGSKIPRWLWREIQRGLAVDPADRHPDMHALRRAIDPGLRRRKQLGTMGLGVGALVTAGVVFGLSGPGPCEAAQAQLAGVWDADVRDALDTRYLGASAWPGVRNQLDLFSTQWTTAWRESCEATLVHETQSRSLLDQRMACLQEDRVAVEAAVQQLERGDRDVLQRAATLWVFERDSTRCRTAATGRRVPPPEPGPARDRYDVLLASAARQYAAAALANEPSEALETLDGLELGDAPHPDVTRAVENTRAEALRQLDRHTEAKEAWIRAARAADAAGDDVAFVHVASTLAFVEASDLARTQAGEVWLERARSRADSIEMSPRDRFTLGLRGAVVLRRRGDLNEAVAALETLLEREGPYASPGQEGTLHHNLGDLETVLRHQEEAESQFRMAIDLRTRALGPDHREVGQSRFMLGRVLIERGELDLAEAELRAAATIFANVEGGAAERVMAEESHAILSAMRENPERAAEQMVSVLALAEKTLEPGDRHMATLYINYARILMMRDRLDEAAAQARRGLELERGLLGHDHPDLVDGLSLLAQIELGRGEASLAWDLAQRAASVAADPDTALQLRVSALMCRAHAQCDAAGATVEARALLSALPEGVSDEAAAAARGSFDGWADAVAQYPPCAATHR